MVPERQSTIILGTLGRAFSCRTTQRCLPAGVSGGPRICWVSRPNRYSHESRGVKRSQRGLAGSARGQIGFVGLGNMGEILYLEHQSSFGISCCCSTSESKLSAGRPFFGIDVHLIIVITWHCCTLSRVWINLAHTK